jgi:hypothetical protein
VKSCRNKISRQKKFSPATLDPARQKASYNGERTAFALIWRKVDPAMRPVV